MANVLGGPVGEHARPGGFLRQPAPWAYLALTVNFVLLMIRQLPCQNGATAYLNLCYSDIRVLWYWRGLQDGKIPYLQSDVEYPRPHRRVHGGRTAPGDAVRRPVRARG